MDLIATDEQSQLRSTARSFLASAVPATEHAALLDADPGWDPSSWARLAELGWLGIAVPEELGGVGLTLVEETIVVEEAAAALLSAPLLSTIGLLLPLLQAGGSENDDLVAAVAAGERRGTLTSRVAGRAESVDGTWTVSGTWEAVPDAERSDLVALTAETRDGVVVVAVEAGATGLGITHLPTTDPTRPFATVVADRAPARLLVGPERSTDALATTRARFLVLAAADAVGIAQKVLDVSVAYCRDREQFDRPIGSYQAVSHQLANVYIALELGRSLVIEASLLGDDAHRRDTSAAAAAAKAVPDAVTTCETAIQVHGGIGMTWESILHRYLKRALGLAASVGPASALRAVAATAALRGGES